MFGKVMIEAIQSCLMLLSSSRKQPSEINLASALRICCEIRAKCFVMLHVATRSRVHSHLQSALSKSNQKNAYVLS